MTVIYLVGDIKVHIRHVIDIGSQVCGILDIFTVCEILLDILVTDKRFMLAHVAIIMGSATIHIGSAGEASAGEIESGFIFFLVQVIQFPVFIKIFLFSKIILFFTLVWIAYKGLPWGNIHHSVSS